MCCLRTFLSQNVRHTQGCHRVKYLHIVSEKLWWDLGLYHGTMLWQGGLKGTRDSGSNASSHALHSFLCSFWPLTFELGVKGQAACWRQLNNTRND